MTSAEKNIKKISKSKTRFSGDYPLKTKGSRDPENDFIMYGKKEFID